MATNTKRLAVLVDADNVPAKAAPAIFKEIASFGDATLRRVYGDFSSGPMNQWRQRCNELALIPHHQPAYTTGKNSSDIALVIDAMDILHAGRVDGFVLVSSDSDFTRLASRIREGGLDVVGIGKKTTPVSLRRACKQFVLLENLDVQTEPNAAKQTAKGPANAKSEPAREQSSAPDKQPPSKVVPLVIDAMSKEEEEWVTISLIGSHLHAANPDFDPRTYGFTKLTDLLEKAGAFQVDRSNPAKVRRNTV